MVTALLEAGVRDRDEPRLGPELGDRERSTVTERRLDLGQGQLDTRRQLTGVRHVSIHALLERQPPGAAADVVARPIAGAVGTLGPVLLVVPPPDQHRFRWAFVERGEVAAEHDEVGAERQRDRFFVLGGDTAVGADRNVHAGRSVAAIARGGYRDHGGGLPASDALLLPRDADRSRADSHLDEVRVRLDQVVERLLVHDVARADLDRVPVGRANPREHFGDPLGVAVG